MTLARAQNRDTVPLSRLIAFAFDLCGLFCLSFVNKRKNNVTTTSDRVYVISMEFLSRSRRRQLAARSEETRLYSKVSKWFGARLSFLLTVIHDVID